MTLIEKVQNYFQTSIFLRGKVVVCEHEMDELLKRAAGTVERREIEKKLLLLQSCRRSNPFCFALLHSLIVSDDDVIFQFIEKEKARSGKDPKSLKLHTKYFSTMPRFSFQFSSVVKNLIDFLLSSCLKFHQCSFKQRQKFPQFISNSIKHFRSQCLKFLTTRNAHT